MSYTKPLSDVSYAQYRDSLKHAEWIIQCLLYEMDACKDEDEADNEAQMTARYFLREGA